MTYEIRFLKHDALLGATPWDGGLDSAKQHAREHFKIQQNAKGATRVEVRDENGNLVFGLPRALRPG